MRIFMIINLDCIKNKMSYVLSPPVAQQPRRMAMSNIKVKHKGGSIIDVKLESIFDAKQ